MCFSEIDSLRNLLDPKDDCEENLIFSGVLERCCIAMFDARASYHKGKSLGLKNLNGRDRRSLLLVLTTRWQDLCRESTISISIRLCSN